MSEFALPATENPKVAKKAQRSKQMLDDLPGRIETYLNCREELSAGDSTELWARRFRMVVAGSALLEAALIACSDPGFPPDIPEEFAGAVAAYRIAMSTHGIALVCRHDGDIRRTLQEQRAAADLVLDLAVEFGAMLMASVAGGVA